MKQFNMEAQKKLLKLQAKTKKMQEKLENEIYEICENMKYIDSSRMSYNIDRLRAFTSGINEFEILDK